MLTRKHFERFAYALQLSRPLGRGPQDGSPDEWRQWRRDVVAVANVCYTTNQRFDRERFYRAAGLDYATD